MSQFSKKIICGLNHLDEVVSMKAIPITAYAKATEGNFLEWRVMSIQDVIDNSSLSRSKIYRLLKDKESGFPKQVLLGDGRKGFYAAEINEWLRNLPRVG